MIGPQAKPAQSSAAADRRQDGFGVWWWMRFMVFSYRG
jgi:hypothetical protein